MTGDDLRKLLEHVHNGQLNVDAAMQRLRESPVADLGFAQLLGRASKESSELAAVEEVMACGGGAEIAEDEVLGHAA